MKKIERVENFKSDGTVVVTRLCVFCDKPSTITVDSTKYREWRKGTTLIQNVFPELTSGQRETLMSGSHEECFDEIFKKLLS